MSNYIQKTQNFLAVSEQFRLGFLETEHQHPRTIGLSYMANKDLAAGIERIKSLDVDALTHLATRINDVKEMALAIKQCLQAGGRIFLAGCGSTGRAAIMLECLWREQQLDSELQDSVIAFTDGGDASIVDGAPGFEDSLEYGAKQLHELGFSKKDLLIACTEGGETPFVIGVVNYAAKLAAKAPFFLYCNPDDALRNIERCAEVLDNPAICKFNLSVGPMALTGSTRMQATTVLMTAVGVALLNYKLGKERMHDVLNALLQTVIATDFAFLSDFIPKEAASYAAKEAVLYEVDDADALCVLSDTVERAGTFNLAPFEFDGSAGPASQCYFYLPTAANSEIAWQHLLGRSPRILDWPEHDNLNQDRLMAYDFSRACLSKRNQRLDGRHQHIFRISSQQEILSFSLDDCSHHIEINEWPALTRTLVLKLLLNTHSTLVMGRLGRYQSNIMTWVQVSNYKLVDRAIRYITQLLKEDGIDVSYDEIALRCFALMDNLGFDESLVVHVVADLKQEAMV